MKAASILTIAFTIVLLGTSCEVEEYPYYFARNELNLSLVIDQSGSMSGDSLANAVAAAKAIVDRLSERDILSIVTFSDSGSVLVEAEYVTDKAGIKGKIDTIGPTGGTYVSSGLTLGYQEIEKNLSADLVHTCLLICDGDVDEGAVTLAAEAYGKGIRTSTIAIGTGADSGNLRKIAAEGHGSIFIVENSEDLTDVFLEELDDLLSPLDKGLRKAVRRN